MTYFCMILLYCNITTLQGADAPRLAMRSEPIGIPNIGNSCFMNAALQALMSLELFVVDLINTSEDEIKSSFSAHIRNALQDNPDVENDIRFYQDFYAFAKAYQAHKASVLDTSYTNKFFEELRGKFACGQQDSASEFLHHLIRLLSISSPYIKHLFSWRVTLKSLLPGGK